MFGFTNKAKDRRRKADVDERHEDALLAQAEMDLARLDARGENAVRTLAARQRRNHWRESIEQMIQGA